MSSCDKQECIWVWVDKLSDIYISVPEGLNVTQENEDGYVDINMWVCDSCGEVRAEVN